MSIAMRRSSAFAMALGLLASLMVVMAPAAFAHHPNAEAATDCREGAPVLLITAYSWTNSGAGQYHGNIQVSVSVDGGGDVAVGSGSFSQASPRGNYGGEVNVPYFTLTVDASGWEGSSVGAKVVAVGPWGNGAAGGQINYSNDVVIPTDCQPGVADVWVQYGCDEDGFSVQWGTENASITFMVGNQVINDPSSQPAGTTVKWVAVAWEGYEFDDESTEKSGQFLVTACRGTVDVDCETVTNTSESGVVVVIDLGGENGQVTLKPGESVDLAPGTYSWVARVNGQIVDQGTVTTEDCTPPPPPPPPPPNSKGVQVLVDGVCSTDPARSGLADLSVTIIDDGNATVTINGVSYTGDAAILGVADETTYNWTVKPHEGYAISGLTADSITIGKCDAEVGGVVVEATTVTTVPAVSGETLPFTGFEMEDTFLLAIAALMVGAGLILIAGGPRKEQEIAEIHHQW